MSCETFTRSELQTLHNELRCDSLDHSQVNELILLFLAERGYGSSIAAISTMNFKGAKIIENLRTKLEAVAIPN